MQPRPSQFRHEEAVTEPSGQGPYAEAMRELIAQLPSGSCSCARTRTSTPRLRLVRGATQAAPELRARGRAPLQLIH